jgi:prepilin peptidase CpaA
MQGGFLSYGLQAALAIALLTAAATDLRRRQIDNWLNIAIAAAAPIYWWASGMTLADMGWQIALATGIFVVLLGLFALRGMGGGDVKLLVALALWIAPLSYLKLTVMMSLIGGALSIAVALFNMDRDPKQPLRNGLGRLAAAVWVIVSFYAIFLLSGGQPLPLAHAFPVARMAPWAIGAVLLAAAAALGFGVIHVVRRQSKPLPIPYGLAISAAGLWLLASQNFSAIQATMHTG